MVRLAGLSVRATDNPDGDIEILVVGARPGEKLREELFYDPKQVTQTRQAKILRARRSSHPRDVSGALAELRVALERADEAEVRRLLFAFVAEGERATEAATAI
jgi:FlaA1/EpsC-like NDP-sugar epimerase